MTRRGARASAMAVVAIFVLAACSKSQSAASSPQSSSGAPPGSSPSSGSPVQGVNPGGDFCVQLKAERAKDAQLGKEFATALTTPDLASIKQSFDALFAAEAQSMARVEATMSSAPANVQAALQVVNRFFAQLKSTVDSATSLPQLEASMTQFANTKQFSAAGKVLAAYAKAQCGSTASP